MVCDLPRRLTDATQAALDAADLVVLVSPCDVRACAAAATMAPVLTAINPNLGLVVRGPPRGLRAAEVADVAGVPLLASMRAQPRLAEQLEHGVFDCDGDRCWHRLPDGYLVCCHVLGQGDTVGRHDRLPDRTRPRTAGIRIRPAAAQCGGRRDPGRVRGCSATPKCWRIFVCCRQN